MAAEVSGAGKTGTELDEAGVVQAINAFTAEVEFAVSADEAEAIQNITGYDASGSSYEIEDTAAELISAQDTVLNDPGVRHVEVISGVNGGDEVTAVDGAVLTSFSADIDFDVRIQLRQLPQKLPELENFHRLDDAEEFLLQAVL